MMSVRTARIGLLVMLMGLKMTRADEPVWMLRTTDGPGLRYKHAMAYHEGVGKTMLFGGCDSDCQTSWVWNGEVWVDTGDAGPTCLNHHSMAYDSLRGVVVLFGGSCGGGNDKTWEWDGYTWTERHPPESPSPRGYHAMAYDRNRRVTVLFGGDSGGGETWEWNGTTWTQRNPPESPSARREHAMAYDTARGLTVLYGGWDGQDYLDDAWEWDGTTWTERCPDCLPGPRGQLGMTYDDARGVSVLYGGWNGQSNFDDTWEWDGNAWFEACRDCLPPGPRSQHAMAYDSERRVSVLFGLGSDTWEYGMDCNENGIPDADDIRNGSSMDRNGDGVPDECIIDCDLVTGLKAKCKYGQGRFRVRATVVTDLPEGTVLGLCLNQNECDLNGNEVCQDVTINPRGKGKARWSITDKGAHCVIVLECPDIDRSVGCGR